jgi:hypothetical protein
MFYQMPHPWDPRYAIPDYVMAEPMGRGTFTTKWLPRGWVSTLPPDYFAKQMHGGGPESMGFTLPILGEVPTLYLVGGLLAAGLLIRKMRKKPRRNPARGRRRRRR